MWLALILVFSVGAASVYERLESLRKYTARRGVFIDLGANCGNSYMLFKRQLASRQESFTYYLFEANSYLVNTYLTDLEKTEQDVQVVEAAGWIRDGSTAFYLDSNEDKKECDPDSNKNPRGASSIFKDKYHPRSDKRIDVITIDMNKWMFQHVKHSDYCVLKVDVEGAEYELLRHLIAGGSMSLVDELYVEFHQPYTHRQTLQWLMEAYPCKTIQPWH